MFLGACGGQSEAARESSSDSAALAPAESPAAPPTPSRFEDKTDDGSFHFRYVWPAEVSAAPALAARLEGERDKALTELRSDWRAAQADAPPDCKSCRGRSYFKTWQVVTDLPRFLSLSATLDTYSGGAHGMQTFDALVWDRQRSRAEQPIAMFRSAEAVDRAIRDAFCDALDVQRAKKRGKTAMRDDTMFNDCIAPVANGTLILGSDSGQAFDRIGFLIPPYNAGPYAEGSYEVTLKVTPALLDAVRDEYRRAFQVP